MLSYHIPMKAISFNSSTGHTDCYQFLHSHDSVSVFHNFRNRCCQHSYQKVNEKYWQCEHKYNMREQQNVVITIPGVKFELGEVHHV